jgi:hypothetical protein
MTSHHTLRAGGAFARPRCLKIEGLRELDAALGQFSKATARGVLHRALKKAAVPIRDQARQDAPVDTGELRDSIVIRTQSTGGSAGKAAFAAAMRSGSSKAEAAAAARAANREAGRQPLSATVSVASEADMPCSPNLVPAGSQATCS